MGFPATIFGEYADPLETSTTPQYPIGQKMETRDGKVYRYTEMGGTVGVANKLYQSSVPVANWLTQAIATAMVAGDTAIVINIGATAVALNELAGGSIVVEETADLGHTYGIASNAVNAGSAESVATLRAGETVQNGVAVAGGNVISILKNPWKDVIISPAGINTAMCIGVPRVIIPADGFGWIQTRGAASVLVEDDTSGGAILVGNTARSANEVAGAVSILDETAGDSESQIIGVMMETAPTADFGHIFLTL